MRESRPNSIVRIAVIILGGVVAASLATAGAPTPGAGEPAPVLRSAELGPPVTPLVFRGDVRSLPPVPAWQPGDPVRDIPRRTYPGLDQAVELPQPFAEDPLLAAQRNASLGSPREVTAFATPLVNIEAQGYTSVQPPDTVGDVGMDHYIQAINEYGGSAVAIYSKTGTLVHSFLMQSLGGRAGYGDPIVLYDRAAGRWLLSEFAASGNYLLVHISMTSDPVAGGWYTYEFQTPNFPDYPKYAIWPTDRNGGQGSYVVTTNEAGAPAVYALDRAKMLAGQAGTFQRFGLSYLPGFSFQGVFIAADADGPSPPPAAAPAILMNHRDTEFNSGPTVAEPADVLQMYEFQVDWATPGNTTVTGPTNVLVADFDANLCGSMMNCVPQPNSSQTLDSLREVVMHRLQYWRYDEYESLVGNFTVDVNGANQAGIRWFQLRGGAGNWAVHDEGTFSPDGAHRWMGGVSSDQTGNIALGYSVSDASAVYPSLRYTGRMFDDPAGVMTQGDLSIVAGAASQSGERWGDYAAMSVDPADDCTFWFTSEYMPSSHWSTRIAAFKFDRCGCLAVPPAPTVGAYADGDNRIEVTWEDSSVAGVAVYSVRRSLAETGPYELVEEVSDTSPGAGSGASYAWVDDTVSGGTTYYYKVSCTDGLACFSPESTAAGATATGACTLAPAFGGAVSASNQQGSSCGVTISWGAATSGCAGTPVFNLYRATSAPFPPSTANRIAAGVTGTSYLDQDGLVAGTYYSYIVRAWDPANGVEDGNVVTATSVVTGSVTVTTPILDGFDGVAAPALPAGWAQADVTGTRGNWATTAATAHPPEAGVHSSPNVLYFNAYWTTASTAYSTRLHRTTPVALSTSTLTATLEFWMYHGAGSTRNDRIQVQVSTNGGSTWTDVGTAVAQYDGTTGWKKHSFDLSGYRGSSVTLGLLALREQGAAGFDLYVDDLVLTVSVGGSCTTLQKPSEVSPGGTLATALRWTGPTGLAWQAPGGTVTGYALHRGTADGLEGLMDPGEDSCTRYAGTATSFVEGQSPPAGSFYWYVVVAENAVGTGPAGSGRVLDSTGTCP